MELTRTSQRRAVYSKRYYCHKSRSLPPFDRPTKSRYYVDKEQRKRKRPSSKFVNLMFRFNITLLTNLIRNRHQNLYTDKKLSLESFVDCCQCKNIVELVIYEIFLPSLKIKTLEDFSNTSM